MRGQLLKVAFLTLLSQGAAFLKLWFGAHLFGISSEMDAYNIALVAPTFVAGILSALIQTGIFPVRSSYSVHSRPEALASFERTVFWACAGIGLTASLGILLVSGELANRLVDAEQLGTRQMVAALLPVLSCLVMLNVAMDTMGFLLAMHDHYTYAAGAPVVNGLIGALLLAVFPQYALQSLVAGTILGVLGQLLVCIIGLKLVGFAFFGSLQPRPDFLPLLRRMATLSAWIIPAVVISNLTASFPMVWSSQFGTGVASTFGYAYRLHTSVVQLLIMASSTVILAYFSKLVANGDDAGVRRFLVNGAAISFVIGAIATAGVVVVGQPLLAGVFAGRFDADAAERVADMWTWLTAGLGFTILSNIFAKLWQAQGRTKLMSVMALFTFIVLVAVFYATKQLFGDKSIALAVSGASASVVIFGLPFVRTRTSRQHRG